MNIEIIDIKGELIRSFELESNPYKVGETFNTFVSNESKSTWDVKDEHLSFKVEKIEHNLFIDYLPNQKVSSSFVTCVTVTEIKNL